MKKVLLSIVVTMLLLFLLVGCGSDQVITTTETTENDTQFTKEEIEESTKKTFDALSNPKSHINENITTLCTITEVKENEHGGIVFVANTKNNLVDSNLDPNVDFCGVINPSKSTTTDISKGDQVLISGKIQDALELKDGSIVAYVYVNFTTNLSNK
ncbi:MAG: hypothetical protein ACOX7H_06420 [Bacillota bacterium]|jgi:hypothetical protein